MSASRERCDAVVIGGKHDRPCSRYATRHCTWNPGTVREAGYDFCAQHADMHEFNAVQARIPFTNQPLPAEGAASPQASPAASQTPSEDTNT